MKALTAYFSVSGNTRRIAEEVAERTKSDLFEIKPEVPYTNADLNWRDDSSRNVKEYKDPSSRPAIAGKVSNLGQYDTVYIGYPIWWYEQPRIVETFLDENDLSGKNVYLFATSGSSTPEKSLEELKAEYPDVNFVKAARIGSASDLEAFLK